jgi:hypothetical protein
MLWPAPSPSNTLPRVNTGSLGVIKTPMHSLAKPEFLAGLQPVGRMGETHDVVDAVPISKRRHS